MQRTKFVGPVAMFWGLTVFMPVGVTYLASVLMLVALLAAGGWRDRAIRLRNNPMWWPVVAYVVWTLIILTVGSHYPETGANLFHGLRIAATVLMALALTREEAIWALRGFWIIGLVNMVMIALYYTVGFPMLEPWRGVLILIGNKSISNALLFTIMAASAAVFGLKWLTEHRPARVVAAAGLIVAVMAIITFTLPSRTSLLALLLVIPAACVHKWRRQLKVLAVVLMVGGVIAAAGLWNTPVVQQKFAVGIQEIEAAQAGEISEASWVVRYYMYRDTARMIIDRPFAGWGIGGWTEQWHLRGPKLLDYKNMPHNDFLWMGAQTGVPGALTLLAILLVSVWVAWKRDDLAGRLAFVATLIVLIATSVNSALRDAQIGLAILWVAMVYLRLAQEPGDSWRGVVPRREPAALSGGAPPLRPL
jgi:O-antigen ligase